MGDAANLYRFNSFEVGPYPPKCGSDSNYYYSIYNANDNSYVPSIYYYMFSAFVYDQEPKLQLG